MSEKEPEVVHLEWERVEDPERDPPPEMVASEAEQAPPIIPRWNDPNPYQTASTTVIVVVLAVCVMAWHLLMRAAGVLGN